MTDGQQMIRRGRRRINRAWAYLRLLCDREFQDDFARWLGCSACQHSRREQGGRQED